MSFIVKATFNEEMNMYYWSVMREDGKSFKCSDVSDIPMVAINFEYCEEGAVHALKLQNRLEQEGK